MNKIRKLLEEDYVINLFNRKVLDKYPDFKKVIKVKIKPHKDNIWQTTYHVVLEFKTTFLLKDKASFAGKKRTKTLSLFSTAHSDEPRENVHNVLKYLWNNGFSSGYLTTPRPLFYSDYFNASFYRGVDGRSLLSFIRRGETEEIKKIVKQTAEWLVKLHHLPIREDLELNESNNQIKTVVPGYHGLLEGIQGKYGEEWIGDFREIYDQLIFLESNFLESGVRKCLVHGDVHPENIIKISQKKIAMIDFADICISDFARDLGTFVQQLDYKLNRYKYSLEFIEEAKKIFLESYCSKSGVKLDSHLQARIDLYYSWTAFRTASFWLMKYDPSPSKAEPLIKEIKEKLKILK